MCLFKKWRARREAKKQVRDQEAKHNQEVILNEENVEKVISEQETQDQKPKEVPQRKPRYHVSQNKDKNNPNYKRWGVRLSNSKRTIKYHDTQLEAIKHAEDLAEKNDTSIVIHKVDGTIRKQNY